jgi:hypothetical protein
MATLSTTARTAATQAVVDLCNAGSTFPDGALVTRNPENFSVTVTYATLGATPFGAASAGSASSINTSFSFVGKVPSGGTQAVATFGINDLDDTRVITLTAGDVGSGADVEILGGTGIQPGQTLVVGQITIEFP